MTNSANTTIPEERPLSVRRKCLRGLATLALKLSIGGGLICWLVASGRLNFGAFAGIRVQAREVLVVSLALASMFVGLFILALRQMTVLRQYKLRVSFGRCLGVTLVGAFVGVVLPGIVGGDIVKAVYLCSDARDRRSHAVGAVVVDRVWGLYSLFLLGTMAVVTAAATGSLKFWSPVLFAAPALTVMATVCILLVSWKGIGRIPGLSRVYGILPTRLANVIAAVRMNLLCPKMVFVCITLSLVNHLMVVCSFLAAEYLLGDHLSFVTSMVLNPLAMVMNVVPLTPGGVGITEGAFSLLYQAAGSSIGANIGLLGRVIQYTSFAVGGLAAVAIVRVSAKSSPD